MRLSRRPAPGFSGNQFADAAGTYDEVAQREGVQFARSIDTLKTPSFEQIKRLVAAEAVGSILTLAANQTTTLAQAPNTRVMVGIKTARGSSYLPGVVLPDSAVLGTRFGCLYAAEDIRRANTADATQLLSDFQQVLLAKIAAEHQPKVGDHSPTGKVNGAEIGHAVVAASMRSGIGIHEQVHSLVGGGALSAKLSELGVTDMRIGEGRIRQNRELVLTPNQIAGVLIAKDHQLPFPVTDSFEVSAGFTLAAQQSRGQAPDLGRNLAGMAT